MNREKKKFFKKKLQLEKERNLNLLDSINNPSRVGFMEEHSTELSSYDNHPADLGTEMFIMEQEKGTINKVKDTLYEIEISEGDLETGDYGFCRSCGKKINEERLNLIPYLKLCIDCSKERIPLDEKRNFRPEEEDVMVSLKEDIPQGVQFDREDSYQAVARFNEVDSDPSFSTGDNLGVYDEEERGIVEDVEKISQEYYDKVNK